MVVLLSPLYLGHPQITIGIFLMDSVIISLFICFIYLNSSLAWLPYNLMYVEPVFYSYLIYYPRYNLPYQDNSMLVNMGLTNILQLGLYISIILFISSKSSLFPTTNFNTSWFLEYFKFYDSSYRPYHY